MKKRKLRILGNDRGLMMLCRDARRRWMQYGENRRKARLVVFCEICHKQKATEHDHIKPLGPRPRIPHAFGEWLEKMFYNDCQALCKSCHLKKTKKERRPR